jgi:hypothetical protein
MREMADEKPQSRPEPAAPGPSVYGGQWGGSGKQNPKETGKRDRPGQIKVPRESEGEGTEDGHVDTQGEN